MERRAIFPNKKLPYLLVAPQMAITLIFFFWPAGQAVRQSLYQEDPFGLSVTFAGLANFHRIFADPNYLYSLQVTFIFAIGVTVMTMIPALLLAALIDRVVKGKLIYQTLLIWPYALAPAVAGILWLFMFNPGMGTLATLMRSAGYNWDPSLNGTQAMLLVIVSASWKQVSYNFLFFLAGMQAIPKSFIEAAAIDGAGPWRRFWTIIMPLISPTTFFLLVVNMVYAFFDTFGLIHAVTAGGPGKDTETLVLKVYNDGYVNLNMGGSSAQSVVLMVIVISLTIFQFKYVERRVHYS